MNINYPKNDDIQKFDNVSFKHSEIYSLVDHFYRQVAEDDVLSVPFSSVSDWPEHIKKMTNFWWIKFGGTNYLRSHYSPIPKHYEAGFNADYLERWLNLFSKSLHEVNLSQEQIEVWEAMANRIGSFLSRKNEEYGLLK